MDTGCDTRDCTEEKGGTDDESRRILAARYVLPRLESPPPRACEYLLCFAGSRRAAVRNKALTLLTSDAACCCVLPVRRPRATLLCACAATHESAASSALRVPIVHACC